MTAVYNQSIIAHSSIFNRGLRSGRAWTGAAAIRARRPAARRAAGRAPMNLLPWHSGQSADRTCPGRV